MAQPSTYITWGVVVLAVGIIALFVPPIPVEGEEARVFAAYWWIAAPLIVIGFVLLVVGRRRWLQRHRGADDVQGKTT